MFYERNGKPPVCANCHQPFPRFWLQTGTAVQKGVNSFCSKKCAETYTPVSPDQEDRHYLAAIITARHIH